MNDPRTEQLAVRLRAGEPAYLAEPWPAAVIEVLSIVLGECEREKRAHLVLCAMELLDLEAADDAAADGVKV